MIVFPAIDVMGGECVRLTRGDFDTSHVYSRDPVAVAIEFEQMGATHLHLVDLDAARSGGTQNERVLADIVRLTSLKVQTGGGIRSTDAASRKLDLGVDRIVVGTAAIRDPEFLRAIANAYPERVVVAVDCLDRRIRVEGWASESGVDVVDFMTSVADLPICAFLATDISRDGMRSGVSLEFYETLMENTTKDVIASGGITSYQDVRELVALGAAGAVIGKAIYEGDMELTEIIRVVKHACKENHTLS